MIKELRDQIQDVRDMVYNHREEIDALRDMVYLLEITNIEPNF